MPFCLGIFLKKVFCSALSVQFSSVAQSCPTLCSPMNCSTPGLPVQHQLLESTQTHVHRVSDAIQHVWKHHWPQHFSMAWCALSCFSRVRLFVTPWTVARQAPLSMGFSRQEHWSGLLCPLPGDLPDPGIEPTSLKSLALAGGFFTTRANWEARSVWHGLIIPQSYSHTAWLLLNNLIGTSTPRR